MLIRFNLLIWLEEEVGVVRILQSEYRNQNIAEIGNIILEQILV